MAQTNLYDLEALEVSLVPQGANKKKFIIYKSDRGDDCMEKTLIEKINKFELGDDVKTLITKSELSEENQNVLSAVLKILGSFKNELPKNTLETISKLSGYELPKVEVTKTDTTDKDKIKKEDINDLPDTLKPKFEALWKQNEEAVKKQKELEQILKSERDERLKKEFIIKAKDLDNIGSPEELGLILKEISESIPKVYEKIEKILLSANKVISEGKLFKEAGTSKTDTPNGAWSKIEKSAELIAKEKGISKEEAITKVLDQNPELYREYMNESNK